MKELQALDEIIQVKTCKDFANVFLHKIQGKYWQYDGVQIVFDTYLEKSVINLTRVGHGCFLEEGVLTPILCEEPCAPESLLKLIKCSCVKNRSSPPCKCLANHMPCTELCNCKPEKDLYSPDYTDADGDEADEADL
ncbi:hypothetical protein JTB14_033421 [Gonioctena quinquepunctata]|nr:hypothetical protein JTB14_033421 [Gonioctena quinquepunctata]